MRDAGAELLVHLDEAPRVGGDAGVLEPQPGGVSLVAGAVQHALGHQRAVPSATRRARAPSRTSMLSTLAPRCASNAEAARELLAQRIPDVVVELGEQAIEGLMIVTCTPSAAKVHALRSRSRRRR